MEREKLKLSKEDAKAVISDDLDGFKVIQDTIESTGRWSENHDIIIQRESDGKYFGDGYSRGLTEMQDEFPYDYSDPDFTEVFPKVIEITSYV